MADGWTALANSTSQLPALGMGMVGLREKMADRETMLGIGQERLAMQQETARQNDLFRQQQLANAEAKIPQHQKVMDPGMILQAQVATKKAYGDAGLKAFAPVFDTAKEIAGANEKSTFGDVYESVRSAYPAQREQMIATLEKELTSGKLSPVEQKNIQQVYDAVMYDKTGERILGEGIFKNTASSLRMEQENSKAALEASRQEGWNTRADQRDERIRELAAENMALKRDKEARIGGPKAEKAPKPPTAADIKRVKDMIATATKDGSVPSISDISAIQAAAEKIGMRYERFTGTTAIKGIPGTGIEWGGEETEAYHLVPGESSSQPPVSAKSSTTLRDNLIQNGYTPAEADDYIARAKKAGKI
jgi:hypothetical protein